MSLHLPALFLGRRFPLLSYQTSTASTSDTTTYTFSTQAIGPAKSTRYVVVGVVSREGADTSARTLSVTVGGVAAAQAAFVSDTAVSGRNVAGFYIAAVPTGTTADVVATFSGGMDRCGIGVWALYDINSATPTDTATSVDTTQTLDVDILANGVAIGVSFANSDPDFDWTGISERFEIVAEGDLQFSGADVTSVAGGAPVAITCTITGGSGLEVGACASFR
jgi:hypothetical protein